MANQASRLYWLPIICTLVPFVATHISWMTTTGTGGIEPCFPYGPDCVSISRTARQFPASVLFKGLMIPHAMLTTLVWYLAVEWLARQGITGKSLLTIKVLSLIAGLFMIIYLVALGVHGNEFRLMRRTGVIIAFSFTFLSQLLLYRKLLLVRDILGLDVRILSWQKWLCLILTGIGLASLLLDLFYSDFHRWNDAIEWWFTLFLYTYFLTIAAAFNNHGYKIESQAGED